MFKNFFNRNKESRKVNLQKVYPLIIGSSEKLNDLLTAGKPMYTEITKGLRIYFGEITWQETFYLHQGAVEKSIDEIKDLALKNLANEVQSKGIDIQGDGMIHEIRFDQKKESSLLLIDNLWTNVLTQVKDDIVVAVPSSDTILFCARSDKQNVKELRTIATNMYKSNQNKCTDQLLVRSFMGEWSVLEEE